MSKGFFNYVFPQRVRAVRREELTPEYNRDLRIFTASLTIPPVEWPDFILNTLSRFDGDIIDEQGTIVDLPFEILCPTDAEIDAGIGQTAENRITDWFTTIICVPVPPHITPRLRPQGIDRMRVVATFLRACFPSAEAMFGVRPANDNEFPCAPSVSPLSAPEPRA